MSKEPMWFRIWTKFLKRQNELNRITKKDVEYLMKSKPSITDAMHLAHKINANRKKPKKVRLKSRSKKKR